MKFKCENCGFPIAASGLSFPVCEKGELSPLSVCSLTGTEKAVCEDISARQDLGREKYGTTVQENPLSLRQWLRHAYEETLDQAIYLKRSIEEIESAEVSHPAKDD